MKFRPIGVVRVLVGMALVAGLAAGAAFGQAGGRIQGLVVDEDGNPIEGVAINAQAPDTNRTFDDTTRSDGSFALIGLTSGIWTFTANIDGYDPGGQTCRVTQGRNPVCNIRLTRIRHPLELLLGDLPPGVAEALETEMNAADAALTAGRYDEAIAGYESLLAQRPTLHFLHVQIGQTLSQKGDHEAAIEAYERALAGDPSLEDARAGIASARLSMGDFDGAEQELEARAGSLDATKEDLYNLGELEFAKGEVDTAAGWYERAAMVDPNWALPVFKLALVALNKGDIPGAKEHFQRVVELAPDSAEGAQAQATLNALP